jgi:hypothetical protein
MIPEVCRVVLSPTTLVLLVAIHVNVAEEILETKPIFSGVPLQTSAVAGVVTIGFGLTVI